MSLSALDVVEVTLVKVRKEKEGGRGDFDRHPELWRVSQAGELPPLPRSRASSPFLHHRPYNEEKVMKPYCEVMKATSFKVMKSEEVS